MRRVSSRQRLAYLAAFDANAVHQEVNSDSDDNSYAHTAGSVVANITTTTNNNDDAMIATTNDTGRRTTSSSGSHQEESSSTGIVYYKGGEKQHKQHPMLRFKRKRIIRAKEEPRVSTKTLASVNDVPHRIPALPDEVDTSVVVEASSSAPSLSALPDDVKMQLFSFMPVPSLRAMQQVNNSFRRLLTSPEASDVVWKGCYLHEWPWLKQQQQQQKPPGDENNHQQQEDRSFAVSDALHLPTAVTSTTSSSSSTNSGGSIANHAYLFSLAATDQSTSIDPDVFGCRWSRSNRRYEVRRDFRRIRGTNGGLNRPDLVLEEIGPSEFTGQVRRAARFRGRIGHGDRCIRADRPLPCPRLLTKPERKQATTQQQHQQQQKQHPHGKQSLFIRLFSRHHHHHHHGGQLAIRAMGHSISPTKKQPSPVWRPFVAPYVDGVVTNEGGVVAGTRRQQQPVLQLMPRLIAYFEVSILNNPDSDEGSAAAADPAVALGEGASECVAVGLAQTGFSLTGRMPGWDSLSWGYHGDDGGIFHKAGHMIRRYGSTFGVGDTVGCGIDYGTNSIFYTLNGKYLGTAFEVPQDLLAENDMYPVVGLDTNALVHCNFGTQEPFLFDLTGMVCRQKDLLVPCMLWQQQQHQQDEVEEVPSFADHTSAAAAVVPNHHQMCEF